jgi:hypothetical protein
MTKLSTLEIKKQIRVKEAWLSKDGLEILYTFNGQEHFETISPAGAAQVMESHGMIIEQWQYCPEGELIIRWISDYDDDEDNTAIIKTASWEMFTQHYTFSQADAIEVACDLEYKRQLSNAMKEAQQQNREKYIGMLS